MVLAAVNRQAVGPLCGILAGRGAAMVRVYAYLQPLPPEVPETWRDLAQPVPDRSGAIVDWRLRYPAADGADVGAVEELRRGFRRWRSRYVADRLAGDVAAVATFLDWADHHCDVNLLHVLRLDDGRIRPHDVSRAAWQAGRAGAAMRASGEVGLGVFAADERQLVRGFVTSRSEVTVLADDATVLTAAGDRLLLEQRAGKALPAARTALLGWRHADGATAVLTDGGWVALHDRHAAQMLTALAPGASHVRIAEVGLSRMFAGLVVNVSEIATVAAAANTALVTRIGPAV